MQFASTSHAYPPSTHPTMDPSLGIFHNGWIVNYEILHPPSRVATHLPAVLFVHGTPWSSDVFRPLANALLATSRFEVVLYDLPGYGRNQRYIPHLDHSIKRKPKPSPPGIRDPESGKRWDGDTSIKSQATALTALIAHLPYPMHRVHVIAHDIAGTIALRAHLRHGVDFASLMLMDANCVLPWGDGFYNEVRDDPDTFLSNPPHAHAAIVDSVVRSALVQDHHPSQIAAIAKHWTSSFHAQTRFVQQIAQANDVHVAEMLNAKLYSKVRCPVKLMHGTNDSWIPRHKMDQLAEMLPVGRCHGLVAIPDAGHLVMLDQPELVAKEVFLWLKH